MWEQSLYEWYYYSILLWSLLRVCQSWSGILYEYSISFVFNFSYFAGRLNPFSSQNLHVAYLSYILTYWAVIFLWIKSFVLVIVCVLLDVQTVLLHCIIALLTVESATWIRQTGLWVNYHLSNNAEGSDSTQRKKHNAACKQSKTGVGFFFWRNKSSVIRTRKP